MAESCVVRESTWRNASHSLFAASGAGAFLEESQSRGIYRLGVERAREPFWRKDAARDWGERGGGGGGY